MNRTLYYANTYDFWTLRWYLNFVNSSGEISHLCSWYWDSFLSYSCSSIRAVSSCSLWYLVTKVKVIFFFTFNLLIHGDFYTLGMPHLAVRCCWNWLISSLLIRDTGARFVWLGKCFAFLFLIFIHNRYGVGNNVSKFQVSSMKIEPWRAFEVDASSA